MVGMEQQRFDAALRALQLGTTRRAGLAAALGVIFGGAGLTVAARGHGGGKDARGRGKPSREGPCGDGSAKANTCAKDGECCTKYCADGSCRCKPNWMACTKSEHCCSGRCVGGKCDGGMRPAGSACAENFNCQDGLACVDGVCTESNKAKCTRANCPGCCLGTVCRVGSTAQACGTGAGACSRCATGVGCANGSCQTPSPACGPATCPTGCCQSGVCVPGTAAQACGSGGEACATCPGSAPNCTANACTPPVWTYLAGFGSNTNTNTASGVAVSADGLTAWVTNTGNSKISIYTRPNADSTDWQYQSSFGSGNWGSGSNDITYPTDIVLSQDELTIWIAEPYQNRISTWSRSDAASATWTSQGSFGTSSTFNSPWGIAVSSDELTMLVADSLNHRISVWTRVSTATATWTNQTTFETTFSGNTGSPLYVALSSDDLTAFVFDGSNDRISVWTRTSSTATDWTNATNFGSTGSGADQFNSATGVAVSADGLTLWVADSDNYRVSAWSRPDAGSTDWSPLLTFGTSGLTPGFFKRPNGLFLAADGQTIWVADEGNSFVSEWSPE
jgi:hypothetical protein